MGAGMWKRLTMLCQWRWWWWLQWCQGLNKWSQILTFPKFALKHIKTKHPHKHTHTYPRASRRWSAKKSNAKEKIYTHSYRTLKYNYPRHRGLRALHTTPRWAIYLMSFFLQPFIHQTAKIHTCGFQPYRIWGRRYILSVNVSIM